MRGVVFPVQEVIDRLTRLLGNVIVYETVNEGDHNKGLGMSSLETDVEQCEVEESCQAGNDVAVVHVEDFVFVRVLHDFCRVDHIPVYRHCDEIKQECRLK